MQHACSGIVSCCRGQVHAEDHALEDVSTWALAFAACSAAVVLKCWTKSNSGICGLSGADPLCPVATYLINQDRVSLREVIPMFRCPASLILFLIMASAASGAIFVVDDDGAGNFTKIQEAINASEIGDVIVVQNGTYPENLVVDRSIVLKGEENPVVEGSGLSDPLVTITSEKVTLEGITFSGSLNDSFGAGAVLVLEDGCKLLNCTIAASLGNGLNLRDSRDHLVSGNMIHDNGYGGVCVIRANSSVVIENQVLRNGKWGIVLGGCVRDEVIKNEVRENGEVGIQLDGSDFNDVVWNNIDLNQEDGIYVIESRNNVIINNKISGNGFCGVSLNRAPNNVLVKNIIHNSSEEGLLIIGSSDGVRITENSLYDNGISGICICGSYFSTIDQNEIFDNEYNGISLRDSSSSVLISDNEIHGNKLYGFYLEDSNRNLIVQNDVYANLHGVIMARSCDNDFVNNKIHDNRFGISLEFSDGVFVSNNDIYSNPDAGVQIKGCERCKVWENYIRKNGGDGIRVSGLEHSEVSRNLIENSSEYGIQALDHTIQSLFMNNFVLRNGGGGIYIYEGEENGIVSNIIEDNHNFNARDYGKTNTWFSNFYSDYLIGSASEGDTGTEPYVIQGRRGAITFDLHPVVLRAILETGGPD